MEYDNFEIPEDCMPSDPPEYNIEAERLAAQKRVLLRRKARKIMFEIRNGANGDGAMLTPEECRILGEAVDIGF